MMEAAEDCAAGWAHFSAEDRRPPDWVRVLDGEFAVGGGGDGVMGPVAFGLPDGRSC